RSQHRPGPVQTERPPRQGGRKEAAQIEPTHPVHSVPVEEHQVGGQEQDHVEGGPAQGGPPPGQRTPSPSPPPPAPQPVRGTGKEWPHPRPEGVETLSAPVPLLRLPSPPQPTGTQEGHPDQDPTTATPIGDGQTPERVAARTGGTACDGQQRVQEHG